MKLKGQLTTIVYTLNLSTTNNSFQQLKHSPSQIHIIFKTLSVIKGNYQFREEKLIKVFVNLQSGKSCVQ